MPTPTKGARMGGSPAHQKHILANLATSLFEHGKITTTEARARRLRPYAEKLITLAKRGDMHARRQVVTVITPNRRVDARGPHRPQPVHRDRPGHGRPSRWVHPDHEDRPPQGRRRPDGRDRAGQGRGCARASRAAVRGAGRPPPRLPRPPPRRLRQSRRPRTLRPRPRRPRPPRSRTPRPRTAPRPRGRRGRGRRTRPRTSRRPNASGSCKQQTGSSRLVSCPFRFRRCLVGSVARLFLRRGRGG